MLRIGPIELDSPAVQAALSGYSDLPMRRVARAHGAPYCIHEVVLNETVTTKGKLQRLIFDLPEWDHPVGGQLMGSDPEGFGAAAKLLVKAGYDVVDINFGCPVPRALGRCRGGYLLGEPGNALEIVDRVVQACAGDVPVTVKMRRGVDDSDEAERWFFEILDGAFERGITGVTVHGRSVAQRYVGPSRWEFLARVKRHLGDRLLLGSGDLFSPHDVLRMIEETGVDGVTVARGCIGNPWIFHQVRDLLAGREPSPPTVRMQREALEMHRDAALEHYGDKRALSKVRTHAIKYSAVHPDPVAARDHWVKIRKFEDFDAVLANLYSDTRATEVSARLTDLSLDAQSLKGCTIAGGSETS